MYYLKGQTVKPKVKGANIFIFQKRSQAEAFRQDNEIILRVHAKGTKPMLRMCARSYDLLDYWTREGVEEAHTPIGTIGADEVTVLD